MANVLKPAKRAAIIRALCEGNSIRSASRLVDVSKDTVMKLMVDLGETCIAFMNRELRNLSCRRLQVDEVWGFIYYCKAKNVETSKRQDLAYGDIWTFTAIDTKSKLVPCFRIGSRDGETATAFMQDLASRLAHRVTLVSDGHVMYLEAVEAAFGGEVDSAKARRTPSTATASQGLFAR